MFKIIKKYKEKYFIPKTVFEANYPVLFVISNLGIFSFKIRKINRKIYIIQDRKRLFIPGIILICLSYIFFDYLLNRSIFLGESGVSDVLSYVIFITQFASGIISLTSFFPVNNKFLKVYTKLHLTLELVDQSLHKLDMQKILYKMLKYNLIFIITGISIFSVLLIFYLITILNEFATIYMGLELYLGYFLPFFQTFVMANTYANITYILRLRFCCVNNILKNYEKGAIINTGDSLKCDVLKLKECISHLSKLMDVVEDINSAFGITVSGCVFALFIYFLEDTFTRLIAIASSNFDPLSVDMFFGSIYNILCQYCLFILPYESEKLRKEVYILRIKY